MAKAGGATDVDLPIRGRFAPSPTGPLHFGSLVAALASWLHARHAGGQWLVRMEDLDPPREIPAAADSILRSLERLGLWWDGEVIYQSTRSEAYASALDYLRAQGHAFECGCTRKEILAAGVRGAEGIIYPGTCREGLPPGKQPRSVRVRVAEDPVRFVDACQGPLTQNVAQAAGDFLLRRGDGYYAYQLAVVVDDGWQQINQIVRGADLLTSTPRQIYLQQLLGLPRPDYLHIPLAVSSNGPKLSKRLASRSVDTWSPATALAMALAFLHQPLPDDATRQAPATLLSHALQVWDSSAVPPLGEYPAPAAAQR